MYNYDTILTKIIYLKWYVNYCGDHMN